MLHKRSLKLVPVGISPISTLRFQQGSSGLHVRLSEAPLRAKIFECLSTTHLTCLSVIPCSSYASTMFIKRQSQPKACLCSCGTIGDCRTWKTELSSVLDWVWPRSLRLQRCDAALRALDANIERNAQSWRVNQLLFSIFLHSSQRNTYAATFDANSSRKHKQFGGVSTGTQWIIIFIVACQRQNKTCTHNINSRCLN